MGKMAHLDASSSLPNNHRVRHHASSLHCSYGLPSAIFDVAGAVAPGPLPLASPALQVRRDSGAAARRATRAASSDSDTLATRYGPLIMPDTCTAPEHILVLLPCHCKSHG